MLSICNIVFAILKGNNATAEMQDAKNFPNIRLFSAAEDSSDTELIDLKGVGEYWSLPSQGISLKVVLRLLELIKYMHVDFLTCNKNVDIKFSAHDAFLE
jgi:hypothetical protein